MDEIQNSESSTIIAPIERSTQNNQKPYPGWAIWTMSILFGPIAAGIIGYNSLMALGSPKAAKIIIKSSILFSIITWVIAFSGMQSLTSVAFYMSLTFCGLIGKTQVKPLMRWKNTNPNGQYASILSCLFYGIVGLLIYILPFIIVYGYQYLHPCPTGYLVIGDFCFPEPNIQK